MKTTWKHYHSRRRFKIGPWLRQYGITSYKKLDEFCNGRDIETPPLEVVERFFEPQPQPGVGKTKLVQKPGTRLKRTVVSDTSPIPPPVIKEEPATAPTPTEPEVESTDSIVPDDTLPGGLTIDKDGYVVSTGGEQTGGS